MKKKLLGLILGLLITVPVFASITVSPTKIEINANKIKNNYTTVAVEIKGDKVPMRYRIYPEYFTISEKSEMVIKENSSDPHNISKKIRFVPSEFTIPAGKSQKVRVNIANIKSLPDGESRAVLFFEDVNAKELTLPYAGSGIGAQLILKTRVGVPIYVDKGNFKKQADIEYLNISKEKDGLYTNMKIVSTGNSKVRYSGIIQVINGKKLIDEYPLNSNVVGNNSFYIAKQKINTTKIKEAGDYTLRVVLNYLDENDKKVNLKKDVILKINEEI